MAIDHHFPLVFLRFSHFSIVFSMVFPWFSCQEAATGSRVPELHGGPEGQYLRESSGRWSLGQPDLEPAGLFPGNDEHRLWFNGITMV